MDSSAATDYWEFLDEAQDSKQIHAIRTCRNNADELMSILRRTPVIQFKGFSIDFNSDYWDLTAITDLNIPRNCLRIAFDPNGYKDCIKLHLLQALIQKKAKAHTLVGNAKILMRIHRSLKVPTTELVLLSAECVSSFFWERRAAITASTACSESRILATFLEFYEVMHSRIADPAVIPWLDGYSKAMYQIARDEEGWPVIPDAYLVPLLETCAVTVADEGEEPAMRITAAAVLLQSQVGLRSGELLGIETQSIRISEGVADEPAITYMNYKTYKGEAGDGSYRDGHTIMNETALRAYFFLDSYCRNRRERLGIPTLIVFPRQRKRYCATSGFLEWFKMFVLLHRDIVPCVNTQLAYPDLSTVSVRLALRCRSVDKFVEESGLDPDDTVVYPVMHSFRVTVATKLHEAGVNLHYIREHMSQIDERTAAGYIRSDRELEKAKSDIVYRSIFKDGARLLGEHADAFMGKVTSYIYTLDSQVKANVDSIIKAASKQFPLRSKVGGICIRCGNIAPCPASDGTDEILCAFGICPNQCQMYFMAQDTLDEARIQMELADENAARGHLKAAANELRKALNIINDILVPELAALDEQVAALGADGVIMRFPDLEEIVLKREDIDKEVSEWLTKKLSA